MNLIKGSVWTSLTMLITVPCGLSSHAWAQETETYREAHSFAASKPAYLRILKQGDGTESLFISSFGLTNPGVVFEIKDMAQVFSALSSPQAEELTLGLRWPNEVNVLNLQFGQGSPHNGPRYLYVADGFLVPFKQTGGIYIIDRQTNEQHKITADKSGWFYHRAEAMDWNGDGMTDLVTARAKVSMLGAQPKGELIALINPGNLNQIWTEELITSGPDVMFVTHDLDKDGSPEVLAAEFFAERFAVYSKAAAGYKQIYVDNTVGKAFDMKLGDINQDGKTDVILTNHQNNQKNTDDPILSSIFAYDIPASLTSPWTRYTLHEGFKTKQGGINAGSPGNMLVFHPNLQSTSEKPWILVSGDGSQSAHLLRPVSQDIQNWSYEMEVVLDAQSTVGESAAADLNGDGWLELLIPAYDNNRVHILELATP